jgi:uncharacterized protein
VTGAGLLRGSAVVVAVWVLLVVLAWLFQRQLIYLPDASSPPSPPDGVEEVTLATDDGLSLDAWFVPVDEPTSTVLVAPGNAGTRVLRLPLARGRTARGHQVLLLDYRGYGGNPGRPHEDGLYADARAAHDHLAARDDVDDARIVHLGESIGSGVAASVAGDRDPAAVVLRSPFPSLAEVGRHHYRFLPVRLLLRERFETLAHLAGYDGPLLVVAGDRDTIVPTALSAEVAEATGARYEQVVGDHNDPALLDGEDYLDAVDAFVRDALGDGSR